MNLPNKITLVRIFLVPVFAVLFLANFPYHYFVATLVFVVASLTDFIDGYLARKNNLVTDLGKFLDPFADKALVCTALVLIAILDNALSTAIIVFSVIIIVRELMITAFRTVAATKKIVLAADIWGKIKTCLQMIGLIIYMLYSDLLNILPILGNIAMYVGFAFLALSTIFAIISATNYILKNKFVLASDNENAEALAKKIIAENSGSVAIAESFTGGNVCASLVAVPNASNIFIDGKVCYSNKAKTDNLGVPVEIIDENGAVSEQTAQCMLSGLKARTGADYVVVTTGNAGPTAEKPDEIGVCYIGVSGRTLNNVQKFCFTGKRGEVIQKGTTAALKMLLDAIISEKNDQ